MHKLTVKTIRLKSDILNFYVLFFEMCIRDRSYGVGVWGTFIVGLDEDDKSVFQRVVDFALENHLYGAMISVPTPFPGSALRCV